MKPEPGSDEAVQMGCSCIVEKVEGNATNYVIDVNGCVIHSTKRKEKME